MALDTDHCGLTAVELELVAGGKLKQELRQQAEKLQEEARDAASGNKGFGGASSLA